MEKTLDNEGASSNSNCWRLLCETSSEAGDWSEMTRVMEIEREYSTPDCRSVAGCLVRVSTQQGDHVAEALTYVPEARISICGKKLVA